MKTIPCVVTALSALTLLHAQEAPSDLVTHTFVGNVLELSPETSVISVQPDEDAGAATYTLSSKTIYVDAAGEPVDLHAIVRGTPVAVQYSVVGDVRRVDRVIVKPDTSTTPTSIPVQTAP